MTVTVEKVTYGGWPNCFRISDGIIEVIATTDVGPRLIHCGFVNEPNLFGKIPEHIGLTGGDEWRTYGGHRLWHSPETRKRCYHPDNFPIKIEVLPDGCRLDQPEEPNTGIEKRISLILNAGTNSLIVEHQLTNHGNWPVTLAPWALSVMNIGGTAILPQFRLADQEGLLPNRVLSLWPYTDMNDPRIIWGSRFILLNQDPTIEKPFKFGLSVPEGWAAYANNGYLFIKKFDFNSKAAYPDYGVNVEVYTNNLFLELESLGSLVTLPPGETTCYQEKWKLFRKVGTIKTETDVENKVLPLL